MGAMATNYPVFLVSRGLEGVGFTLIALVGATTAGIWFPPHKVGVAMGMISTCIGVGGFLVMAIAPRMTQSMGWQSVWWLTAALSFASLVSVAIFIKMPPWMTAASASLAGAPAPKGPGVGEGFANRNIWLWAVAYLCVFIPAILFMYYMTYLTKAQGFSLEKAGMVSSLGSVGSLIGAPLAGFLIGKLGHLKISLTAGILLYCVLILLAFNVTGIMIPIWMVLVGIVGLGFIPVVCMSAVPGIMLKPQLIGIGMAIAGFGANVAGMIGPPFFGRIVEKAGWNAGAYALIPVALVGIIFVHMTKIAE
jgi:MFS family permease